MEKKRIRQAERELAVLNSLFTANPDFDYARSAEIAGKASDFLVKASAISRGCPKDLLARDIHRRAVDLVRRSVDAAYPPGFWKDYWLLKERNSLGLAAAVKFLEADPWFFRSGYTKADLIGYIRHIDLPPAMAERLRQVVLAAVEGGDRREFRQYCRLARKVDSPELRKELSLRLQDDDLAVRRCARWALNACEKPG